MKAAFTTQNPFNVTSPVAYVFNSTRPLDGIKTIENGEWFRGRFWALCEGEDAGPHIKNNVSLDAYRLFTITDQQFDLLALQAIPEKYKSVFDKMTPEKQRAVLDQKRQQINESLDNDGAILMMIAANISALS